MCTTLCGRGVNLAHSLSLADGACMFRSLSLSMYIFLFFIFLMSHFLSWSSQLSLAHLSSSSSIPRPTSLIAAATVRLPSCSQVKFLLKVTQVTRRWRCRRRPIIGREADVQAGGGHHGVHYECNGCVMYLSEWRWPTQHNEKITCDGYVQWWDSCSTTVRLTALLPNALISYCTYAP